MGNETSAIEFRDALKPKKELKRPGYNFKMTFIEKEYIASFLYKYHTRNLQYLDLDFKLPKDFDFLIQFPFNYSKNQLFYYKKNRINYIQFWDFINSEIKTTLKNEKISKLYNLFLDFNWKINYIHAFLNSFFTGKFETELTFQTVTFNNNCTDSFFQKNSMSKNLSKKFQRNSTINMVYTQIHGFQDSEMLFYHPIFSQFSDGNLIK